MGRGGNPQQRVDLIERASDSSEEEEVDEQLQVLLDRRDEIAQNIEEGQLDAAIVQGCMGALEVLLFEQPPAVENREEAAEEHTVWATSHPRFLAQLAQIREAFVGVIPAGDLFLAMVKHRLEEVLRGADTLTVVTIQTAHQDDQPPGPSAAPPGPSAAHPGPSA